MSKVERTPLESMKLQYEIASSIAATLVIILVITVMWGYSQYDMKNIYKGEYYIDKYHENSRIIDVDVAPPAKCKSFKAVDDLELQMRQFEQEVNKRRLESQLAVEVAQNTLEAAKLRLESLKLEQQMSKNWINNEK